MSNAFIQVPPQSTGLKVQTFENTVGANVVESEAVTLVRSSDNTEVGTSGQPLRVDPTGTTTQPVSGTVAVSNFPATQPVSGSVSVSNFPATQPISAVSLPLPANAAQETGGNLATLAGTVSAGAVAVSAASLPLPTGAATSANQTNGNQITQVSNFPATQAVSGSVSVTNLPATQAISAASLPLPANAAQETGGNLATIATQTRNNAQLLDALNAILSQLKLLNLNFESNMGTTSHGLDVELLDSFPPLN
jgi:hypothetical protein